MLENSWKSPFGDIQNHKKCAPLKEESDCIKNKFQNEFKGLLPQNDDKIDLSQAAVAIQLDHWKPINNKTDFLAILYKTCDDNLLLEHKPAMFKPTPNKCSITMVDELMSLCPAILNTEWSIHSTSDNANNMLAIATCAPEGIYFTKIKCMEHSISLLEKDLINYSFKCETIVEAHDWTKPGTH